MRRVRDIRTRLAWLRSRGGTAAGAAGVLLLLLVAGTISAWIDSTGTPDGYVESISEYLPPSASQLPVISGIERDGETLTTTNGVWTGSGQPFEYEYQWRRCNQIGSSCVDISGATGQQYVLTPDDVEFIGGGRTIRVRVTATSAYGADSAESAQTGIIQARPPVNQTPPTITGTARENVTLSASTGTWTGTKLNYSYQWQRCNAAGASCVSISGATTQTYVVSADDQGSTIRVSVTANNVIYAGGGSATAGSAQTAVVTALPSLAEGVYATNGTVNALHRSGGSTYIGGTFSMVGKPVGSFSRVDAAGVADFSMPVVTGGYVNSMESDGAGGWYIGGTFTRVGGLARDRIARVLADGSVDPTFNPGANESIFHFELEGTTLFVAGRFTTIAGQARNRLAALNPTTGAALAWNPNVDGDVYTLLMNGSTMYVGGSYNSIAGVGRTNFAEISTTTTAVSSLNIAPNAAVLSFVKSGSILYLSGSFTAISGGAVPRGYAAAVNVTTGAVQAWNPNANGRVRELRLSGSRMYMGGEFTTMGGVSHSALVGVDATTGAVNWNPPDFAGDFGTFGTGVWVMHVAGANLWVGGEFRTVGGQARRGLAAFDLTTANLTSWAPQTSGTVRITEIQGATMLVGGVPDGSNVFMLETAERTNAAAFDSAGAPTAWKPDPNASVHALQAANGKIYIGGDFVIVGGQARNRLASVDPATGVADSWNPNLNATVRALAFGNSTVYAGGDFTLVGATTRNRAAAFDSSGNLTTWNPNLNGTVRAVQFPTGSQIFLGGDFTMVGATARNRAASINTLGTLQTWNPNANGTVRALYPLTASLIYLGGDFTTLGATARNRIGLTSSTGAVQSWNPNANGTVWAIRGHGATVWAGGQFTTIGGQSRTNVAALRASDGTANGWNPGPEGIVRAVLPDDSGVHIGGDWVSMGQIAPQGYAHFR